MLRRSLGPIQIQLISLGGIIGSAYFMGIGAIIVENGATTILAFLLGGLIAWLVAMAMGELCVGMAREGSFVSHSSELIGRPWAAAVGWSYWFNWCAYIPSEMIAAGMILHQIFPQIPVIVFSSFFAALITLINFLNVKSFGNLESAFAILKIGALAIFTVLGTAIFVGLTSSPHAVSMAHSPIFTSNQMPQGGTLAFLLTMVLVLVNFQGTELIALSAAETHSPEKNIPRATKTVGVRIIALFVLPITVLALIFPRNSALVEHSIFADALSLHGYGNLASFFKFIVVTAALSCANSGLYGAVRSLYGLGKENLAPQWVTRVNSQGVPAAGTALTIAVCWSFLPLYLLFEGSHFYTWLLSLSGFTGALCWISITWCQIRLRRKKLAEESLSPQSTSAPIYKMPGFPYLSWLSLGLQIGCLSLVAFHPTLRSSLFLGIPVFVIPGLFFWLKERSIRLPLVSSISEQTE